MKKFAIILVMVAACGGGGVSDSKKLVDLSVDERKSLCEEIAEDYGQRTVTCGNTMVTIGSTKAECATDDVPPAGCMATAGEVRACFDAFFALSDAVLCSDAPPPTECAKVFSAECSGT